MNHGDKFGRWLSHWWKIVCRVSWFWDTRTDTPTYNCDRRNNLNFVIHSGILIILKNKKLHLLSCPIHTAPWLQVVDRGNQVRLQQRSSRFGQFSQDSQNMDSWKMRIVSLDRRTGHFRFHPRACKRINDCKWLRCLKRQIPGSMHWVIDSIL